MKRGAVLGIVGVALVAGAGCSASLTPTTSAGPTPWYVWGRPAGGQSGHPPHLDHARPTIVEGVKGTIVELSTSNSDAYALTSTGAVYAWGDGASGELGDGSRKASSSTAVRVDFPSGVRIASLPDPMPFDGGMAIDTHGHAWGWGNDEARQFCQPHRGKLSRPVEVPLSDVTAAVGALSHTTYDASGRILSCGNGYSGQLGNGTTGRSSTPSAVEGLPKGRVTALVASWGDAGALFADGSFYDWGYNHQGQLGDGDEILSDTAVHVSLPASVRQLSQGGSLGSNGQTLALLTDGQVWEWGDGSSGQLGDGTRANAPTPRRLREPPGVTFVKISSGGATDYAITRSGQLWAWGQNTARQLGTGAWKTRQLRPKPVDITLDQVSSTASVVAGFAGP